MNKCKFQFPACRISTWLLILILLTSNANGQKVKNANVPLFSMFQYDGQDNWFKENPLSTGQFYSLLFQGCYPDPSITKRGSDFFLVNSSFAMVPGIPIFHSTDLVNWKQIGHVLDRSSQLKVDRVGISEGIYAPAISYNAQNKTFYLVTTQIGSEFGNMVVKTMDPFSGWSDPIKLQFNGIDPSLFFDEDGKAYLVHNDAPESGKKLYEGHRVIKIWEYDVSNDRVIPGTDKVIVDGGVDISQKPIWIEGPHLYKKDGKYFLMCAEGGTGDRHSEVIFVSNHPKGPFQPASSNPILTQRYLSKDRPNRVEWTGHADLIQTQNGKYYGVFLGVRPNEKGFVNTGRETFILPVNWSGDFPVFENGLIPLKPTLKLPENVLKKVDDNAYFPNGNFTFNDDFKKDSLDFRWVGIRTWPGQFTKLTKKGLKIVPMDNSIETKAPTSALFFRQQHLNFTSTVTVSYKPVNEKDLAGMVCYQSESFHFVLGITKKNNADYLILSKTEKGVSKIIASTPVNLSTPIRLQVVAEGNKYYFNYALPNSEFKNLGGQMAGEILSTNIAGGFTGSLIGLYSTKSNGLDI